MVMERCIRALLARNRHPYRNVLSSSIIVDCERLASSSVQGPQMA
jgi:hypothetical protein